MSRCPFLLPSDSWCVHVILISLLLGNNTQKQGSKRHRHHSECSISAKINHIGCLQKTSPRIFLAALPPQRCHMSFAFTFTTPWDTRSVWDSTTLTSPMAIMGLSNRNPCKQCTSFQLLIWINSIHPSYLVEQHRGNPILAYRNNLLSTYPQSMCSSTYEVYPKVVYQEWQPSCWTWWPTSCKSARVTSKRPWIAARCNGVRPWPWDPPIFLAHLVWGFAMTYPWFTLW